MASCKDDGSEKRPKASSFPGGWSAARFPKSLLASLALAACLLLLCRGAQAQSTGSSYVYDALGRLVAVYDASGNAAVYKYDAVGNLLSITNAPTNQLSSIEMSSSQGTTGSNVTIYGTDFCSSPTVTFDGTQATVVSADSTEIVAAVPSGASNGQVEVTCPNGSVNAGTFTVASDAPPSISGFTPAIGTSGTAVTISGANFQPNAVNNEVAFADRAALVTSASATSLGASVPNAAVTGHVLVATPYGQAATSGYFYVPPAGISPSAIAIASQISVGGSAVTGTFSTAGTKAMYAFDAVAGQQVSLSVSGNTLSAPWVSILNPDGSTFTSTQVSGGSDFIDVQTLPATGTYVVYVDSNNSTGNITLQLFDATAQTGAISIGGSAVTVTASAPGQDTYLTFSGTAGQQISLNVTNSSFGFCPNVGITIYNPDGSQLASSSICSSNTGFIDNTTLNQTGTYTIFIDVGAATGSLTLQLFNAATQTGAISIGGSAVTVTASVPGQDTKLTFSGTAGQQISVNVTNSTFGFCPNVVITIYNPDGSQLTSSSICSSDTGFIDSTTLNQTGTYTVFIDVGDVTGSLTLQLFDVATQSGAISIGGPAVTVTANAPGQDSKLTFSGRTGQQISLNVTNSSFGFCPNVGITIYNPDGSQLASSTICSSNNGSIAPTPLSQTGTYSIFVDVGDVTGSLTLQLYNGSDLSGTVNTSDAYATAVLADQPLAYWRLDESGPATAVNAEPAIKYAVPGPTTPDTAVSLGNGTSYISTTSQITNPSTYSVEIWFQTTTQVGGKLIGFGSSKTGSSGSYDRQIYMTNSGQLIFGQNSGSDIYVTSPSSYNDGNWHQAVGTYDGSTLTLYVDGIQVASTSSAAPQNYSGYWRIGYDNLFNWPSAPTSYYFKGSLGEAAVWNSTALTSAQVSNHFNASSAGDYDSVVLADSPSSYWKLNESSGPTFADATGGGNTGMAQAVSDNGIYVGGVTFGQPGIISTDNAITLDGSSGYVTSFLSCTNPGPFSVEIWFKTTTTAGGKLIGFGGNQTGSSGSYDRNIYMTNSGQLIFGTSGNATIQTPGSYNDGNWHYAVGTWANNTLSFYVDGSLVGAASGGASNYTGYWRLGYDNLAGTWPSQPSSYYFAGTIDEAAVYSYALSATQVANHYHASGR